MNFGIGGKVAFVAAGSKGIGFATAQQLVLEQCHVSICARDSERVDAAVLSLRQLASPDVKICGYVADVTMEVSLANWIAASTATLGAADILVTNTGGPPAGTLDTMSDALWLQGFESTLLNVVRMVRLCEGHMKAQKWGRIVHNTSLVAREPNDILPISSTLRAGLMALTRLQSNALAPFGITVNSVLPGHTMTDRQKHLAEIRSERESISVEEALARQALAVPAGRLGTPDEIAAAIAFLCSKPAAYISGTNLLVDGGLTKGLA